MAHTSTDNAALPNAASCIAEWHNVDKTTFEDIIAPRYQPAVLRGFIRDWPAVAAGTTSPQAIAGYLRGFDVGSQVESFVGAPDINGRFFYTPDLKQLNFRRTRDPFDFALDRLLAALEHPNPPALYMGSTSLAACMPAFLQHNRNPVLESRIIPNIWIGNRSTIAPHFDMSDNIACVVAGRRRFTLFPPEQVANLYVGPIDFTPAGQPASMVNLAAPDLEKYPLFSDALAAAQVATLEPGDAIYIPTMWWHNVEALDKFNVLVNYWWDPSYALQGSPFECLVHALLTIRSIPAERREAWRAMFNHYIFDADEHTHAHLPPESRRALGKLTPELAHYLNGFLINSMKT